MRLINVLKKAQGRLRNLLTKLLSNQDIYADTDGKILQSAYYTRADVAGMLLALPAQDMLCVSMKSHGYRIRNIRLILVEGTLFGLIEGYLKKHKFPTDGTLGAVQDALELTMREMDNLFVDGARGVISTRVAGLNLEYFNLRFAKQDDPILRPTSA